jgi:hypothetical protein
MIEALTVAETLVEFTNTIIAASERMQGREVSAGYHDSSSELTASFAEPFLKMPTLKSLSELVSEDEDTLYTIVGLGALSLSAVAVILLSGTMND